MNNCPNCGWRTSPEARFCENCGADLQALRRSTPPPAPSWPEPPLQQRDSTSGEDDPTAPEWRMAPLPHEEPPPRGRRLWIWVLIIALLACLAFCLLSFGWLTYTGSGQSFQTRISEEQTIQAGG